MAEEAEKRALLHRLMALPGVALDEALALQKELPEIVRNENGVATGIKLDGTDFVLPDSVEYQYTLTDGDWDQVAIADLALSLPATLYLAPRDGDGLEPQVSDDGGATWDPAPAPAVSYNTLRTLTMTAPMTHVRVRRIGTGTNSVWGIDRSVAVAAVSQEIDGLVDFNAATERFEQNGTTVGDIPVKAWADRGTTTKVGRQLRISDRGNAVHRWNGTEWEPEREQAAVIYDSVSGRIKNGNTIVEPVPAKGTIGTTPITISFAANRLELPVHGWLSMSASCSCTVAESTDGTNFGAESAPITASYVEVSFAQEAGSSNPVTHVRITPDPSNPVSTSRYGFK